MFAFTWHASIQESEYQNHIEIEAVGSDIAFETIKAVLSLAVHISITFIAHVDDLLMRNVTMAGFDVCDQNRINLTYITGHRKATALSQHACSPFLHRPRPSFVATSADRLKGYTNGVFVRFSFTVGTAI